MVSTRLVEQLMKVAPFTEMGKSERQTDMGYREIKVLLGTG